MKAYIAEKAKADKILDYSAFLNKMSRKIEDERHGKKVDVKIDKIKLNYQRYRRINKTYQVSTELQKLIRNIHLAQYWYVITEDWCGDSGQILPYLDKIVEINPEIKLKLLLREENPEIMNHYMTDGKRAIPKLISVDIQGRELFQWGPRPKATQKLFEENLSAGFSKPQIMEKVHAWYAQDQGRTIESEFSEILNEIFKISAHTS